MIALGMALLYAGYVLILYGYILVKGYDVSVGQLFGKTWPPMATA